MRTKWTYNACYEEAKKYKSSSEFANNNKSAFNSAVRNKWLKDFNWFKRPESKNKKWNKETIFKEAHNLEIN